jgi:hypothetical protein
VRPSLFDLVRKSWTSSSLSSSLSSSWLLRVDFIMSASPLTRNVGFLIQSNSFRSPQASSGPSGRKQQQSQLKTIVQQFGDVLLSWKEYDDVGEKLLSSFVSLSKTMQSITTTCRGDRLWVHQVLKTPCPLPPCRTAHPHYPFALSRRAVRKEGVDTAAEVEEECSFADLEDRLLGPLLSDVELMRWQLRSCM